MATLNDYKKHKKELELKAKAFIKESDPSNLTDDDVESYKELQAKIQRMKDLIADLEAQEADDAEQAKDDDMVEEMSAKSLKSPSVLRNMNAKPLKNSMATYMIARNLQQKNGSLSAGREFAEKVNDFAVVKELTATANPNLIPQQFLNQFQEGLWANSVVRQSGARTFQTDGGNLEMPIQTGKTSSYWISEGAQPTDSDMTIGNFKLGVNKIGSLTSLSNDFIRRSAVDAAAYLQDTMVKDMALTMDYAYMFGTGTTQPTGVVNVANVVTTTNSTQIGTSGTYYTGTALYQNTLEQLLLMETYAANANVDVSDSVFWMNTATKNFLRGIVTELGVAPFAEEINRGELLGHKIFVSNQIPTNYGTGSAQSPLFFVKPSYYWIADTLNVQFDASPYASYVNGSGTQINTFAQDLTAYRLLAETDGNAAYAQGLVVSLNTGWTPTGWTNAAGKEVTFPSAGGSTSGTVSS